MAERIKITYATLRNDNEELHALYEAGLEKARARLGALPPELSSAARSATARARSSCARRSTRDILVGTFARGTRAGRPGRHRRRPRRAAGLAPAGLARSASRSSAAAADLIRERQMEYGGADGHRGRQEPPRGARRGRGGGRPHPLLRDRLRATTTATTTRWTTSATRPSTPARSSGRTACSRSSARSTSRWRCPPARRAAALMAGNTVVFKPRQRRRHDRRRSWPRPTATPACRTASSTSSWARARRSATELQENPGIDGIVFTGSYEVGFDLFRDLLDALPAAVHRRDGRQEPGDRDRAARTSRRRPRASCARPSASAARSARPTAGSTSSGPVHDELVRLLVEKTEKITIGDPLQRDELAGPDHRPARRRPPPAGRRRGAPRRPRLHRRRAPDRRRPGRAASTSSRRSSAACRPTTACSGTSCSRRSPRSRRSTRSTRRSRLANDNVYGLTAGVYSEDPAEVEQLPRRDRGRRPVRQPARRRDDRRLAGRPAVRRLEGLRLDRQVRPGDVLRRAVPARAEPDRRRLTVGRPDASRSPRRPATDRLRGRRRPAEASPAPGPFGYTRCVSTLHNLYASAPARAAAAGRDQPGGPRELDAPRRVPCRTS